MSSLAHEQVNFCHLPVQLSSVNTQYNPPPISSGGMWLRWRYLSKKRFACLRTVMAECPQNRAPAARPTPLYADTTPSPALNYHYALAAAQISDFLKLHWRAGRGKGSVRTSSGIRLHGQLAICSLAVLTLPRKTDQTWEGLLWILNFTDLPSPYSGFEFIRPVIDPPPFQIFSIYASI